MNPILVLIDDREVTVEPGTTVAAAILDSGMPGFRTSLNGTPRGPLCAMGICFECRVTINGERHRQACMELCRPGMEISTHD